MRENHITRAGKVRDDYQAAVHSGLVATTPATLTTHAPDLDHERHLFNRLSHFGVQYA
jgi:hypothetical protein